MAPRESWERAGGRGGGPRLGARPHILRVCCVWRVLSIRIHGWLRSTGIYGANKVREFLRGNDPGQRPGTKDGTKDGALTRCSIRGLVCADLPGFNLSLKS
jgi:hypothetical protein